MLREGEDWLTFGFEVGVVRAIDPKARSVGLGTREGVAFAQKTKGCEVRAASVALSFAAGLPDLFCCHRVLRSQENKTGFLR